MLERYDPLLDEELSPPGREAVIRALDHLEGLRARFSGETAIAAAADRLRRALAARIPELATAYDHAGGKTEALFRLAELGLPALDRRLRNRLVAGAAGLTIGGALVYTVVVLLSR